jgi:hypothetical protein
MLPPTNVRDIVMFYFNNCRGRDHARLFGSGAFYDLNTTGLQSSLAKNLSVGELCIVATPVKDGQVEFLSFEHSREEIKPDDEGKPCRVMFGSLLKSETLRKGDAAHSRDYSTFFDKKGNFKRQSVLQR